MQPLNQPLNESIYYPTNQNFISIDSYSSISSIHPSLFYMFNQHHSHRSMLHSSVEVFNPIYILQTNYTHQSIQTCGPSIHRSMYHNHNYNHVSTHHLFMCIHQSHFLISSSIPMVVLIPHSRTPFIPSNLAITSVAQTTRLIKHKNRSYSAK